MARRRHPRSPGAPSPWPFVGMAGLASAFFLYAASGLLAPWWAAVVLMVLWTLMLVLALLWWSRHPRWLVGLAVFAFVFWYAAMVAGGVFLDWSA